jgi:hypothetical protein
VENGEKVLDPANSSSEFNPGRNTININIELKYLNEEVRPLDTSPIYQSQAD